MRYLQRHHGSIINYGYTSFTLWLLVELVAPDNYEFEWKDFN